MCSNIWPSGARPAYIYHVIGCIPAGSETPNKHYLTLHFKSGDQKKKVTNMIAMKSAVICTMILRQESSNF